MYRIAIALTVSTAAIASAAMGGAWWSTALLVLGVLTVWSVTRFAKALRIWRELRPILRESLNHHVRQMFDDVDHLLARRAAASVFNVSVLAVVIGVGAA